MHITISSHSETTLSEAQKKFNAKLAELQKQQQTLAAWQQTHEQCQNESAAKYEPLWRDYIAERIKLACVLDDYLTNHKFNRQQANKLTDIVMYLCQTLITQTNDAALAELHARYHPTKAHETNLADWDTMREQMADLFDLNEDDANSFADDFMAQQHQQYSEQNKAKKSTKKPSKAETETNQALQSLQQVYRQLVASLHPDREPDANERERKTQLMQTVTVAYEQQDLFKLLELQLTETKNNADLSTIADTQLKNYTRLLEQQIKQCKADINDIQMHYKTMLGIAPYHQLTPKRLTQQLKEDTRHLTEQLKQTRSDRQAFERDIEYLKTWLKYVEVYPEQ